MFIIYQITYTLNQKSYIGFTTQYPPKLRWAQHQKSARRGEAFILSKAIRKYGAENFQFEILEGGWNPEIGKAVREPFWISTLKPEYNMTAGGEGVIGYHHTELQKKHQSFLMKEFWNTKQGKKLKVDAMLGKKNSLGYHHTDEHKKKMSMRMRGEKYALGARYTRTEEDRKAISLRKRERDQNNKLGL